MTDPTVARLERRLARERSARVEAERIAERGMRELYLANQDLDLLVAARTRDLEHERFVAQQASQSRSQFLAALSRQVRSPLNGVLGTLELLEGQVTNDQAQAWVTSATRSAEDLLRLFSRLLLFVQLDDDGATDADNSPTELDKVGTQVRERWARPAITHGKLLIVDDLTAPGTAVSEPPGRLGHLLDELIENAIVHADPGPVRVELREADGEVTIEVTDDGPGIADVDQLLDPSIDDPSGRLQSLGMGYPLIRRLTDQLNATVAIDVAATGGTTVRVTLAAIG